MRREGRARLAVIGAALAVPGLAVLAEPKTDAWLAPASRITAAAAAALLRSAGLAVERSGSVLSHPAGFGIYVNYVCTALPLVWVLLVGLTALPGRLVRRLLAGAAGATLLLALNQLRLVSLFWIGSRWPEAFDAAHRWVWEPVMLSVVAAVWLAWSRRSPADGLPARAL